MPKRASETELRAEIVRQLRGGNAHAKFADVVKNFPADVRGKRPRGLPYSAWQLLEHIRIAQADILSFCKNSDGSYKEMKWPDDYWPKSPEPPSAQAWTRSIRGYNDDLDAFVALIEDPESDLFTAFPWGSGQTLLHEAFLLVDHVGYHLGEIVAIRRLLGIWPR